MDEVLTTPLRKKNVKNYPLDEMLPLETKQSGGKLLPHSDLQEGVFLVEVSSSRKRNKVILLGTWNVKLEGVVGTGLSWLRIGTDGDHLWVR